MAKPLIEQCSSLLTQILSHPLFSILTTFLLLNLLYIPNNLLSLLFSPVPITTSLILTTLLHFGSPRRPDTPPKDPDNPNPILIQPENSSYELQARVELHGQKTWPNMFCNRGGPLEVIYEEYEGEESDGGGGGGGGSGSSAPEYSGQAPEYSHLMMMSAATPKRLDYFGYCTSSTESDADSDDETSSENNVCFRWDEDEEGMIEIALEEDNLIEIDLSACK